MFTRAPRSVVIVAATIGVFGLDARAEMARGIVYNDFDKSGTLTDGEPGLADIMVSNGRQIVKTDATGAYQLEVDDDDFVFIIKPRNWQAARDATGRSAFWYRHCPVGAPANTKFPGVAPTGPLPASIDFPLWQRVEPSVVRILLFGDPQPATIEQVNLFARDIVPDVLAELTDPKSPAFGASFGISLGDIVHDDLALYGPLGEVVSCLGIPWINVPGNHDMNYEAPNDADATQTFNSTFGPSTYAFQWGPVMVFVLDDVVYEGAVEGKPDGPYHGEFSADQLAFMKTVIAAVEPEFVIATMHIPIADVKNRAEFIAAIGDRPSLSIAAHWHTHADIRFQMDGTPAPVDYAGPTHHHLIQATTCGSWWTGARDEFGIPHAMMRDGRPNGWSVLQIRGTEATVEFKAARRPWSDQMHIVAPDEIDARLRMLHQVIANIYAGSERSIVEMRVVTPATGAVTEWVRMEPFRGTDPYWAALKERDAQYPPEPGLSLTNGNPETLLWQANFPPGMPNGGHVIEVRTKSEFGQEYYGRRVVRVVNGAE